MKRATLARVGRRAQGLVIRTFTLLGAAGVGATGPGSATPEIKGARVWQDSVVIPSYEEGLPDPNPPFDLFRSNRFNYPYTLRNHLTDRRANKAWRALWLENEYLKCLVLPDLGGHLYRCTDKRNGQEMFYANPSIKFAAIAYRGAWAALGIEFNFPVSHNWMTVSPVDFATTTGRDGSASVWIGNIDRPYGMQWRVELTLRPGRAVLEQHTTLYNRADVRHRFYWWTNAGVEVWDDTKILYPMEYTASHGFTFVDTWPIDSAGHDLSVVSNHKYGSVSRFAHLSREPYMAVYHPKTKSGVAHYSSPTDLPAKKLWSWSSDADGLDWRRALSDNNSAYVEVQAGLFRNQETYGFLEPQQSIQFAEYWIPMLDLDGLSRATPDVLLNLSRTKEAAGRMTLNLAVNVQRAFPGALLTIMDGEREVAREIVALGPETTMRRTYPQQFAAGTYSVRLTDASSQELLRHTEGSYESADRSGVTIGPQPSAPPLAITARTDADYENAGTTQELEGQRLMAIDAYREGLQKFPDSIGLNRAAGRLLVALKQYDASVPFLRKALARVSNDRETAYYLGVAERDTNSVLARMNLDTAEQYGPHRSAALLSLAGLSARGGAHKEALRYLGEAVAEAPLSVRAGGMEVALLRVSGQAPGARERLEAWRGLDPTSSLLRYEATRLGASDPALWEHLAADPERILELVADYLRFGLLDDALDLLTRSYPNGSGVVTEPGMPRPESYPLIAYYRGYVRSLRKESPDGDYAMATTLPTTYVFPNRPESMTVLRDAVARQPKDATAQFLLGSLHLSAGDAEAAIKAWELAGSSKPTIPTLHRNLGFTFLQRGEFEKAIAAFREGTKHDARNIGVYTGLEEALLRAGRPPAERAQALLTFPDQKTLPASLVYKLATALAEAERFDEADRLFTGRFFPREEGGINVRRIWLDVRLRRGVSLAKRGDCRSARGVAEGITRPVAELSFTRDGLEPILVIPALREAMEAIRVTCGSAGKP